MNIRNFWKRHWALLALTPLQIELYQGILTVMVKDTLKDFGFDMKRGLGDIKGQIVDLLLTLIRGSELDKLMVSDGCVFQQIGHDYTRRDTCAVWSRIPLLYFSNVLGY